MEPSSTATRLIRFGVFEADVRAGELRKQGLKIKLQDKPFQVLVLLLEGAGDLVTREELRAKLWPGDTFVDFDHGINIAINKLREALNDSAESPRFIETLARRGYRFIAGVERSDQASAPSPVAVADPDPAEAPAVGPENPPLAVSENIPEPPVAKAGVRRSRARPAALFFALIIAAGYAGWRLHVPRAQAPARKAVLAVLPFENLSSNPQQNYFSDGLTDEMITELGRLHPEGMRVIARTTMMQYRSTRKSTLEIGRELGANYILEGSVRRSGERVRISAQLIQAKDQTQVWADSYDRDLSDVLGLQADVARAIADSIRLRLTPAQIQRLAGARAVNPEAYEDYLKGRYAWNQRTEEGFEKAIAFFNQAVAADRDFAPAYAGLADTYSLLGSVPVNVLPPRVAMPKAREAAVHALRLDDTLAEAHVSLGYEKMAYEWDFPGAEAEFKRAIELNPAYSTAHQWYAFFLTAMGRPAEARTEDLVAQKLDPLSLPVNSQIAWSLYVTRQYDQAVAQSQKTIELAPKLFTSHLYLGFAYEGKGMYPQALAEFQKAGALSGGSPIALAALGQTYALSGERTKARKMLVELQRLSSKKYVPALYPAAICIGLGEKDAAIRWLTKAVEDRSDYCILLGVEPGADRIRSDPRFQKLLRRIGLPN